MALSSGRLAFVMERSPPFSPQKFLQDHMGQVVNWMGLTDQNGPWRWVDGTDYDKGFK
jgi:hypothetical protein